MAWRLFVNGNIEKEKNISDIAVKLLGTHPPSSQNSFKYYKLFSQIENSSNYDNNSLNCENNLTLFWLKNGTHDLKNIIDSFLLIDNKSKVP